MILGTNRIPEVIPEEEIDSLRTVVNGIYKYDPYPYLREGTRVVVTREPLYLLLSLYCCIAIYFLLWLGG